jgi:hypothetical protein
MTEPSDELLERYADAVAQDARKPSDRVRNAARAHAQMLRDQAAVVQRLEGNVHTTKPAANQSHWTLSLVASLAVIGLAGLIYVQIDPGTPDVRKAGLGVAATAPAPAQIAAKATGNGTVRRSDTAQPVAGPEAAQKSDKKMADAVSDAGPPREAPSQGISESTARIAPATIVSAAAPQPGTAQRARQMQSATPSALFLDAARTGNTEALQQLLAQGVAINTRDANGNTALTVAVRQRQAPIVRALLEMGADTRLTNREGLTALQLANQLGLADMVELLQASR